MSEFIQVGKTTHIRTDRIESVSEEPDGSLLIGFAGGGTLHVKADDEAIEKLKAMAGIAQKKDEGREREQRGEPRQGGAAPTPPAREGRKEEKK